MFKIEVIETSKHIATIAMNGEIIGRLEENKIIMPGYTLTVDNWQAAVDWTYRMFDDVYMTYCDEFERYQEERAVEIESGLS